MERTDYFERLTQGMGDAVITTVMPSRVITYVNPAAETMFGCSRAACVDRTTEFLYPDIAAFHAVGEMVRKAIREKRDILKTEQLLKRCDGTLFTAEMTLTFLRRADEAVEELIAIIRDITERKKIEERMVATSLELERKNLTLGELVGQIELERSQMRKQVATNIEKVIVPMLTRVRRGVTGTQKKYLDQVIENLASITSSFGYSIAEHKMKLSGREIEICDMIKNGLTSKEIAETLHIAKQTVDRHRHNIRKKFALTHKKINSSSFFRSL